MGSLLERIETVPAASLGFYPGNARRGDVPMIAESLRENEQYAPLVVQTETSIVPERVREDGTTEPVSFA